jgi:hypothetical protein
MSENLDQIVDEMHRSANARYLLEWIQDQAERDDLDNPIVNDIAIAVSAYFEANER